MTTRPPRCLMPHPDVLATSDEMLAAALAYARTGLHIYPGHVPAEFGTQGHGLDRGECCAAVPATRFDQLCKAQAKHGVSNTISG